MATLLSGVTSDTTGADVDITGPCTVWVRGGFAGGVVRLRGSDTTGAEIPLGQISELDAAGAVHIAAVGSYKLAADLVGATAGSASVTAETTQ